MVIDKRAKICRKCISGSKSEKNYCRMGVLQEDPESRPKICRFFKEKSK